MTFARLRPLLALGLLVVVGGAGAGSYTLRWGDTLGRVARKYGVPIDALVATNNITNPNKVREGTTLTIPDKAAAQVATATPIAAVAGPKIHLVAKGDTLGAIAKRYKITVDELKKLNDIKDERRVRDGRTLTLPDSAEGAATAGSSTDANAKADRPQPVCPVVGAGKFDFSNSFGAPRHGHKHMGNDIFAKRGRAVVAPMAGTLRRADGGVAGRAWYIDGDDGVTYYGAHLDTVSVGEGRVERGQPIGTVGTSGNAGSTPPHLHFEIHPGNGAAIDPYNSLRGWCKGSGAA
jgi:murein DD-endopeptidase MepM/ murein hydrolase activator NlpD